MLIVLLSMLASHETGESASPSALLQLSSDPYTNLTSQHKTAVEPDAFSYGATIVTAFQVGRFFNGGSSNIGWATSQDAGQTWNQGLLSGITIHAGGDTYERVSDPAVAYDAKHATWLIIALPLLSRGIGSAVTVSRSTNGGTIWSAPVLIAADAPFDKTWIVCDNTPSSRFYGNCYAHWAAGSVWVSSSSDGGLSWGAPTRIDLPTFGFGGQPVVQPNGTVIVPFGGGSIGAFRSTNGGASWSEPVHIAANTNPNVPGIGLRTLPFPSVAVDAAGRVFVVWSGCHSILACYNSDLLLSKSDDGLIWTPPMRIPTDLPRLTINPVIPGLAADPVTAGNSAHLGLAFYYYFTAPCKHDSGKLLVGFVSSVDGGTSWSTINELVGPTDLHWLANTNQGFMVGDYIDVGFAGGRAFPIFSAARVPQGGQLDQAIFTVADGIEPGSVPRSVPVIAEAGRLCQYLPIVMSSLARHTALR